MTVLQHNEIDLYFILLLGLIMHRSQTGQCATDSGVNCGQTRGQNWREQSLTKGKNKFWNNVKLDKTHLGGSVGPTGDQLLTPDLAGEAKT